MTQKIPIIYIGHGLTGYYGLQKLKRGPLSTVLDITTVITSNKDKEHSAAVEQLASDYGLTTYHRPLLAAELSDFLSKEQPSFAVIMSFDQKIPLSLIQRFPRGVWNVHPSALPKYRGGKPLEYMIVDGAPFQVCVHEVTEHFDSGNIIYRSPEISIWDMDIDEVHFFAAKQSAVALEKAVELLLSKKYTLEPQDPTLATYAHPSKLDQLLTIDWKKDHGERIFRKILAGGKGRGAYTHICSQGSTYQFNITDGNFFPHNGIHHIQPQSDGSYAVPVVGGTLYFTTQAPKEVHHALQSPGAMLV